jgi:hypothetical protein
MWENSHGGRRNEPIDRRKKEREGRWGICGALSFKRRRAGGYPLMACEVSVRGPAYRA